ncbi:MAG: two-component system sensor histidine kinase NtrB [bacterium]
MSDRSISRQEALTTVLFLIVLLAMLNGVAWFMYRRSLSLLEEDLGRHLVSIGRGIAAEVAQIPGAQSRLGVIDVSGDARADERFSPHGLDDRLVALLGVYDLDNVALLTPSLEIVASARGEISSGPAPVGAGRVNLDDVAPVLAGEAVHTRLFTVSGETFKSAYVPVYGESAEVNGIVAVDASASFLESAALLRRLLLFLSCASLIFAGLVALLFRRTVRAIVHLEESKRHQEKLSALGTMAAGVAHEVRNPLGIIRATTELLAEESAAEPERKAMLDSIIEEVDRLDRLLTNFLAFSRTAKAAPADSDIVVPLRECLRGIDAEFARQGITVAAEIADLPLVRAEPSEARQVFLNLLLNARDAMPDGGAIRVSAVERTIRSHRRRQPFGNGGAPRSGGRFVEVAVADTGVGMTNSVRDRILDPFFTTKPGGTGLGLSVVHGIVTGAGGYVEIETKEGKGTLVRVGFPVTAP